MAVAYVVLRIAVFHAASVIEFPDSESFMAKATSKLNLDFFLDGGRFFLIPLIYKIVRRFVSLDMSWLTVAQVAISIPAWLALAWSFARMVQPAQLALPAFVATLAVGLSTDLLQWDRVILSESITTSFFVLFLAAWIRLGEKPSGLRFAAVLVTSTLFSLTREANALFLAAFGGVLLLWALWYLRGRRRAQLLCLATAGVWLAFTAATQAIAQRGDRWVFPLLNVIGKRVLTSPERMSFYQAQGMPVTDRLRRMAGEFGSGQGWAFYTAPELADFRTWLQASGRTAFTRDLTGNPMRTLAEPLKDVTHFTCPVLSVYEPPGTLTVLPDVGQSSLCTRTGAFAALYGSVAGGLVLIVLAWLWRRRVDAETGFRLLTIAALLLGWPPLVWFIWQVIGDMEVGRHVLSGTLQLRLGFLIAAGYAAAAIRARLRQPERRAPAASSAA